MIIKFFFDDRTEEIESEIKNDSVTISIQKDTIIGLFTCTGMFLGYNIENICERKFPSICIAA